MEPKHLRFGGGLSETSVHPLVIVAMLISIGLILALPRKKAITPFLLAFFTIPVGQVLVLGGLHLTMLQVLIVTVLGRMAAFRITSSQKVFAGGFNVFDKIVVAWTLIFLITLSLQFMEMQAFIKGLGDLIVSLGGYLAARFLVPDRRTVLRAAKTLALVCVIQGAFMVNEQFSGQNVFSQFGANPPVTREGNIRSEGALGTLYAGAFGAVLIPMFLWLWTQNKSRIAAYAGIAGATAMVFSSHASTSWGAYAGSLVGLAFWPLRKQMRLVRWGIVAMLVGLHMVMNGPVWSLLEKIDLTGGSSSYHRYMLVDNCIRHFSDWWLIGCTNYGKWGFDMWDLCNQFVVNALTGGLLALILYLTIFKRSFGAIGSALKRVRGDRRQEWLFWCLGSSLFANIVAHFGINYMVHLSMCFFVLVVCVSATTYEVKQDWHRKKAHVKNDLSEVKLEPAFAAEGLSHA